MQGRSVKPTVKFIFLFCLQCQILFLQQGFGKMKIGGLELLDFTQNSFYQENKRKISSMDLKYLQVYPHAQFWYYWHE